MIEQQELHHTPGLNPDVTEGLAVLASLVAIVIVKGHEHYLQSNLVMVLDTNVPN